MTQNLILRSAVVAALGAAAMSANAGTLAVAGTKHFAAEAAPATSAGILMPSLTYQTAVPINANSQFYVYVNVGSGAGLSTSANLKVNDVTANPGNSIHFGAVASIDTATVYFPATVSSNGIASGQVITMQDTGSTDLNTLQALATAGTQLSATWTMSTVNSPAVVPTTGLVDTVQSGIVADSANSVTAAVINSANFTGTNLGTADSAASAETAKINLAGNSSLTLIGESNTGSPTVMLPVGAVTYTVNTSLYNSATAANIATSDFVAPVVTLGGDLSPAGTTASTADSFACTGNPVTLTKNSAKTSASNTIAGAAPGALVLGGTQATGTIVGCVKYSGAATINPTQFTLSFTQPTSTGHLLASITTGTVNAYALKNNAASLLVHSYVPASLAKASGTVSYLRVINTSSLAAVVNVAVYDDASGSLGTAAVLGTLNAGASATYSSAQVEGAVGTIANSNVHSLQLSAPVGNIAAQTFVVGAGGVLADTTAVATYNGGAASNQ